MTTKYWIILLLLPFTLLMSGCIHLDKRASREQVAAYLQEKYYNNTIELATSPNWFTLLAKEWTFTMAEYPEYEFTVTSGAWHSADGVTPLIVYDGNRISDDAYQVMEKGKKNKGFLSSFFSGSKEKVSDILAHAAQQDVQMRVPKDEMPQKEKLERFQKQLASKYGNDAAAMWSFVPREQKYKVSKSGFALTVQDVGQLALAEKMVTEYFAFQQANGGDNFAEDLFLRVAVDNPVSFYPVNVGPFKIGYEKVGSQRGYLQWLFNNGRSLDSEKIDAQSPVGTHEAMQKIRADVIAYACLADRNVAGVTNDMRREARPTGFWNGTLRSEHDFRALPIHQDDGATVFVLREKLYNKNVYYLTRQAACEWFRKSGLTVTQVSPYRDAFAVVGVDGKTYTFHKVHKMNYGLYTALDMYFRYDVYDVDGQKTQLQHGYKVDFIDEDLIRRITGRSLPKPQELEAK